MEIDCGQGQKEKLCRNPVRMSAQFLYLQKVSGERTNHLLSQAWIQVWQVHQWRVAEPFSYSTMKQIGTLFPAAPR